MHADEISSVVLAKFEVLDLGYFQVSEGGDLMSKWHNLGVFGDGTTRGAGAALLIPLQSPRVELVFLEVDFRLFDQQLALPLG